MQGKERYFAIYMIKHSKYEKDRYFLWLDDRDN